MSNEVDLTGRVAIVTGAGGGIGRAHALMLAQRGARVVVNDLGSAPDGSGANASPADQVVQEIRDAGGEAVASHGSVATAEGAEEIVSAALDAFGTVDVLVNNAGILRDRSFTKLSAEDIDAVLAVHLRGAFNVTQPVFNVMKENGYGRIVFTSSTAGLFGNFGQANYAAAKTGLVGLSNSLALEGERHNIRSNVIAPMARSRLTEELLAGLGDMAELLDPAKVAPLVVYLASEACGVTKEIFTVGGGRIGRVFVGLTQGVFADAPGQLSPEYVADSMEQILETDGFVIPADTMGDAELLMEQMKASA